MAMTVKPERRSVVNVLGSQVWILLIQENDLSASVLPIGKTFRNKVLTACFADSEEAEMDSLKSDASCRLQWFIHRNSSLSKDDGNGTRLLMQYTCANSAVASPDIEVIT